MAVLVDAFTEQVVAVRYVKGGEPTSEQRSYDTALRPVVELYGNQPVGAFTPLALAVCRDKLIEAGYTRKRINQHVQRIRRCFKWGVSQGLVPETVWRALGSLESLRAGERSRTGAVPPESARVLPVLEAHIEAIEGHVTPPVWAAVQVQLWTGARPGEVLAMRTADIEAAGDVWVYRPERHKTQHHGKTRVILLGPKARAIVEPWLRPAEPLAPLFSPAEARRWYFERLHADAKSPRRRRGSAKVGAKRRPRTHYSTATYGRAIARACRKAGVPSWHPHQLRHNAATRLRAAHGIELAQIILGHSCLSATEIYAEADMALAAEAVARSG